MSPDQLRRHALEMGAELEIEGQRYNVDRQQLTVVPKPAPKPVVAPRPVPAVPAVLTREQVQAMLDAQRISMTAEWAAEFVRLQEQIARLSQPKPKVPHAVAFQYDKNGAITGATITPKD